MPRLFGGRRGQEVLLKGAPLPALAQPLSAIKSYPTTTAAQEGHRIEFGGEATAPTYVVRGWQSWLRWDGCAPREKHLFVLTLTVVKRYNDGHGEPIKAQSLLARPAVLVALSVPSTRRVRFFFLVFAYGREPTTSCVLCALRS